MNVTSDRLLDDCALDQKLGVLRRSVPRTYAWRVKSESPSTAPGIVRRCGAVIGRISQTIFSNPLKISVGVGRVAQHAALAAGFVAAVLAVLVSILEKNEATTHVATGFISFTTVATMTLLFVVLSLHLLNKLGVDIREIVCGEE